MEAVFCREAFRLPAAAKLENDFVARWLALNNLLSARKPARESRAGSASLGANFLQVVLNFADLPLARVALDASKRSTGLVHHSTAFGLACSLLGFDGRSRNAGVSTPNRCEPRVVLPTTIAARAVRGGQDLVEFKASDTRRGKSQRRLCAGRCMLLHAAARLGRDGASRAEHPAIYQLSRHSLMALRNHYGLRRRKTA